MKQYTINAGIMVIGVLVIGGLADVAGMYNGIIPGLLIVPIIYWFWMRDNDKIRTESRSVS